MKKIKKIVLDKESLSKIKAGDGNGYYPPFDVNGSDSGSGCTCNCMNCNWIEGGGGFSAGLMYAKIQS